MCTIQAKFYSFYLFAPARLVQNRCNLRWYDIGLYYITLTINALIFLFIYSNDVGDTTVNNEGNANGILLSPDTIQSNMLNLTDKPCLYTSRL